MNSDLDVVDVAVIGAGIVGAAVASELAADHEVAVLEAEPQPDRHASGRSAAVWRLIYGDEVVSALIAESRPFLESPPADVGERSFLRPRPVVYIAQADERNASRSAFDKASAMVSEVERIEVDEAYQRCPGLRHSLVDAFVDPTGADIDVAGLHQGFLRRLKTRGGRLELSRPVQDLTRSSGRWRIDTDEGAIEARVVVNAAGAWGDQIAARAGVAPAGLTPLRRTVITFDPGELRHDDGPMVVSVSNRFYFKPETGTVLASPFDEQPDHPGNAKPKEAEVARLIDRLAAVTTYEAPSRRTLQSSWAGLRTFCPDRRPTLGWDVNMPGFFWAVGLGGYGIETAPAVAALSGALFRNPSQPSPLPFAPGRIWR